MKLKCIKCGFTINVMESELMDSTECSLCGGAMVFEESANYLADQEKYYGSPGESGHDEIKNETEGMNEQIDNLLITSMINDIERNGEEKIWGEINHCELELRLKLIPIYIEAKQRIKGE